MLYIIKNKNLTQFLSKQGFTKRLTEALQQNVCVNNNSLSIALKMSNEILYSGAPLKIKHLYFKVKKLHPKKKPFVGKLRAFKN